MRISTFSRVRNWIIGSMAVEWTAHLRGSGASQGAAVIVSWTGITLGTVELIHSCLAVFVDNMFVLCSTPLCFALLTVMFVHSGNVVVKGALA
jgi:hypothetical protein